MVLVHGCAYSNTAAYHSSIRACFRAIQAKACTPMSLLSIHDPRMSGGPIKSASDATPKPTRSQSASRLPRP